MSDPLVARILSFRVNLIPVSLIISLIYYQSCSAILQSEYLYPPDDGLSRLKQYTLELTEGIVQPDNYKQMGYLINGNFPGPTLFVNQFDTLEVKIINRMTLPTTIHFHGLLQEHTFGSDGVPHVTQDPIPPNGTFLYQIQIGTQTGTFMYHGHVNFDIVFIHGAIIIRDNPSFWYGLGVDYQYEVGYEHTFVLEAVYHYNLEQFVIDVTKEWKGKPPIMSLPINGHSYGEWEKNNGNAPGYEVVKVIPGKTYRLRVINLAAESFLRFRIEGHRFRVIEMDGILCFPTWTDRLEINSGQRYSVMVHMDRNVDNFWIHSEIIDPFEGGPDNGRAILSYVGAPDPTPLRKQVFSNSAKQIDATSWILPQLMPNMMLPQSEVYSIPKKKDRRILIDAYMRLIGKERKFYINGHHFQPPNVTYRTQVRAGLNIAKDSKQVYEIMEGQVIDIVFQNRVMDDGPCLQHPWHLHGHSFWVIAEGPDTVDMNKLDNIIENNIRGGRLQFRDVVTMFPYQRNEKETNGAGCGWTVIRFTANNPGIWIAHCHITTHMLIGKEFVLYEHNHQNARLYNE